MDHSRILLVQLSERNAAAIPSLLDKGVLRLFRPIYWRKECDNALHIILAQ